MSAGSGSRGKRKTASRQDDDSDERRRLAWRLGIIPERDSGPSGVDHKRPEGKLIESAMEGMHSQAILSFIQEVDANKLFRVARAPPSPSEAIKVARSTVTCLLEPLLGIIESYLQSVVIHGTLWRPINHVYYRRYRRIVYGPFDGPALYYSCNASYFQKPGTQNGSRPFDDADIVAVDLYKDGVITLQDFNPERIKRFLSDDWAPDAHLKSSKWHSSRGLPGDRWFSAHSENSIILYDIFQKCGRILRFESRTARAIRLSDEAKTGDARLVVVQSGTVSCVRVTIEKALPIRIVNRSEIVLEEGPEKIKAVCPFPTPIAGVVGVLGVLGEKSKVMLVNVDSGSVELEAFAGPVGEFSDQASLEIMDIQGSLGVASLGDSKWALLDFSARTVAIFPVPHGIAQDSYQWRV